MIVILVQVRLLAELPQAPRVVVVVVNIVIQLHAALDDRSHLDIGPCTAPVRCRSPLLRIVVIILVFRCLVLVCFFCFQRFSFLLVPVPFIASILCGCFSLFCFL